MDTFPMECLVFQRSFFEASILLCKTLQDGSYKSFHINGGVS